MRVFRLPSWRILTGMNMLDSYPIISDQVDRAELAQILLAFEKTLQKKRTGRRRRVGVLCGNDFAIFAANDTAVQGAKTIACV